MQIQIKPTLSCLFEAFTGIQGGKLNDGDTHQRRAQAKYNLKYKMCDNIPICESEYGEL